MKNKKAITHTARAPRVRLKLIDRIHNAVLKAGIKVNRDGWNDWVLENGVKTGKKDFQEWLDILVFDKSGNKYEIHFYFENNSNNLRNVDLFFCKKKTGWKNGEAVASTEVEKWPESVMIKVTEAQWFVANEVE